MTVSRFSISCYARWSLELAQLVVLTPWNFSSFQPRALPRWWLRPCCWAACFAHQTQVSPFGSFRLAVFALERGASPAFWIPLAAFCCVRFVNSFLLGGCVTTTGLETSHLIGVGLCPWCRAGCVRTPSVEPARLIVLANCQAWFARQSMEPAWLLDPCVRFFSSAPPDDWKNGLCFRWCWAISLKAALFRGNVRQALPSRQEMGPACLSRSRVKLSREHHGAGGKTVDTQEVTDTTSKRECKHSWAYPASSFTLMCKCASQNLSRSLWPNLDFKMLTSSKNSSTTVTSQWGHDHRFFQKRSEKGSCRSLGAGEFKNLQDLKAVFMGLLDC